MQDRVGTNVPTEEQVAGWVATINEVQREMASYGVGLTAEERKHALRFRLGGEPTVRTLAALVRKHSVALPGITADGMEADLRLVQRMKPVREAIDALFQFTDDTMLEAGSECWYAATAYYTALSRMVTTFPDIKVAIDEIATFFARRRRRAPATVPAVTAAEHQ